MITKIGIIYQDGNSIGFLRGLHDRLRCKAEFIAPPAAIGKSQLLTSKQAKSAWAHFQKKGVELIVRFTDADRRRWQEIQRTELSRFPDETKEMVVCGIAVECVEDWLCLDDQYASRELGIPREELADSEHRTGRVKRALVRLRDSSEGASNVMQRLVCGAPTEVFRRWLDDKALRTFYSDCRAAAAKADCETPNELETPL